MWRQPKAFGAVAFTSAVAFLGIGLVNPILKSIAASLHASPSQVSLLFTSYLAVRVAPRLSPMRWRVASAQSVRCCSAC